jgi:hypothetical protein
MQTLITTSVGPVGGTTYGKPSRNIEVTVLPMEMRMIECGQNILGIAW